MARSLLLSLFGVVCVIGCQRPMIGTVPSPNLNGPSVSAGAQNGPMVQPLPMPPVPRAGRADVPSDWLPVAPSNGWKYIIVHHSATPAGSAAKFDRDHRAKGWDELGYHFVIGNGTLSGDGQVEVGSRWSKQKHGAHAKTADGRYNDFGIGICLVGNFELERPTPAQTASLAKLVGYLMNACNIPADQVMGHRETKATACPGRHLNLAEVRRQATILARQFADSPYAVAGKADSPPSH